MLFKTAAEIKQYAQFTGAIQFDSLAQTLRLVENVHLVPVLGRELYKTLSTLVAGTGTPTEKEAELLVMTRGVAGPYLCYYYAPKADVQLNDGGMRRAENDQSKTAFQYQAANFREANLREGELATELLLDYLETNRADFSTWTESSAFTAYRALFIKSGAEFNTLFSSHSPCRNYWAMRAKMLEVEENIVRVAIGETLFKALKDKDTSKVAAPSFTEKEKELITRLKRAIACFTVAFAIPLLNVRVDANGLSVITANTATNDGDATRGGALPADLAAVVTSCQESGQRWLVSAVNYLKSNAADFADWTLPEEEDPGASPNEGLTTFYGLI